MTITQYGPGDEATWPACSGHPNDPRNDGEWDDLVAGLEMAIEDAVRSLQSAMDDVRTFEDLEAAHATVQRIGRELTETELVA